MARPGITYYDVQEVADQLTGQGQNPTNERIRTALGGGSFSTISKYMQAWRADRMRSSHGSGKATPPDPVGAAVHRVWDEMNQATAAQIEAVKAEAQVELSEITQRSQANLEEAQQQVADTLRDLAQSQHLYDQVKHQLADCSASLEDTRARLAQIELELATANGENAGLQRRLSDQADHHTAAQLQLQQQLEHERSASRALLQDEQRRSAEAVRDARDEAKSVAMALEAQLHTAREQLDQAHACQQSQGQEHAAARKQWEAALSRQQAELTAREQIIKQHEHDLAELREAYDARAAARENDLHRALMGHTEALRGMDAGWKSEMAHVRNAVESLQVELAATSAPVEALKKAPGAARGRS